MPKSKKKPKVMSIDLFYLLTELSKPSKGGNLRNNKSYLELIQRVKDFIEKINKKSAKIPDGPIDSLEAYSDSSKQTFLECNLLIIDFISKLKKDYSDNSDISKDDKTLITSVIENIEQHAYSRLKKYTPYRGAMSYITKLVNGKTIHRNHYDYLLLGDLWASCKKDKNGEITYVKEDAPGGGFCYGATRQHINKILKSEFCNIPASSREAVFYHTNQRSKADGIFKPKEAKSIFKGDKTNSNSGYMLAKKIVDNLEKSKVYLVSMHSPLIHHAMSVATLPPESKASKTNGFKYELFDSSFHVGYYKTKIDFLTALAVIYDSYGCQNFISVKLHEMGDYPAKIPEELSNFLASYQNIHMISIDDIHNLLGLNSVGYCASTMLKSSLDKDASDLARATNSMHLFSKSPAIFQADKFNESLYLDVLRKRIPESKLPLAHKPLMMSLYLNEQFKLLEKSKGYKELATKEIKEKLKLFSAKSMAKVELKITLDDFCLSLVDVVSSGNQDSEQYETFMKLIMVFNRTHDLENFAYFLNNINWSFIPKEELKNARTEVGELFGEFNKLVKSNLEVIGDNLSSEELIKKFSKTTSEHDDLFADLFSPSL